MDLARSETVVADNLVDRAMTGRHWNATAAENNSAKPWRDWFVLFAFGTACRMARCRFLAVRPEGADYQWRKIPPGDLWTGHALQEDIEWTIRSASIHPAF
jgi:hypothetical protein